MERLMAASSISVQPEVLMLQNSMAITSKSQFFPASRFRLPHAGSVQVIVSLKSTCCGCSWPWLV